MLAPLGIPAAPQLSLHFGSPLAMLKRDPPTATALESVAIETGYFDAGGENSKRNNAVRFGIYGAYAHLGNTSSPEQNLTALWRFGSDGTPALTSHVVGPVAPCTVHFFRRSRASFARRCTTCVLNWHRSGV